MLELGALGADRGRELQNSPLVLQPPAVLYSYRAASHTGWTALPARGGRSPCIAEPCCCPAPDPAFPGPILTHFFATSILHLFFNQQVCIMDNSQQQPWPTAYAHLLRHPDSGYNSPLSSPFFGRRAAAAGLSTLGFPNPALYGSVDSLVAPSFSITQAPDMTRSMSNGWMASAGLSDASCNSANV
jgi:hypothetical protein